MHISNLYIFTFILLLFCGFACSEEEEEVNSAASEVTKPPEDVIEEEKEESVAPEEESEESAEKEEEQPKTEKAEEEANVETTEAEEEEATPTPKPAPPETTPEEEESTEHPTTEPTKTEEEAPEDTYAVWSSTGKICLLAKFNASVTIYYPSKGENRTADIRVPLNGNPSGKCGTSSTEPVLKISWGKYSFKLTFDKTEEEDKWFLSAVKLTYDTSERLFDGATDRGQVTAKNESLHLLETPLGKSYACHASKVIDLHSGKKRVAQAKLRDIHLQPYEVENGKFSTKFHCDQVDIDGLEPFVQDETIPLAVGCTLALITLLILIGFSVHRAYNAAKVDYNSME